MKELLSEKEIMEDYVLSKMVRYNHRYRLQDETVAAHSFYVSLFCLKIMAKLKLEPMIERQVLILAALHDTAESKTSDIPHDVKCRYPKMQEVINEVEDTYYRENWKKYVNDVLNPCSIATTIVSLADAYSVYQFCMNENILGNISEEIQQIKAEAKARISIHVSKLRSIISASLFNEGV